jgi:hypothetical protein
MSGAPGTSYDNPFLLAPQAYAKLAEAIGNLQRLQSDDGGPEAATIRIGGVWFAEAEQRDQATKATRGAEAMTEIDGDRVTVGGVFIGRVRRSGSSGWNWKRRGCRTWRHADSRRAGIEDMAADHRRRSRA